MQFNSATLQLYSDVLPAACDLFRYNVTVMTQSPSIPHVVIIGGGTGSYVLASGLRQQPVQITMLMTMVDDGGSNKTLRDEFGLLPTSGIRQAIVALSENQTVLRKLFTYRYHQGGAGLYGMTFGNLFMAAMSDIMGSQKAGIEETCRLLQVKGQILPISYDDVKLVATYEDGSQVVGEHLIDEPERDQPLRITSLATQPTATISPEAKTAILDADLIILGPGDFYTNTIANLVVEGVPAALSQTDAKIMFVTNLMTKLSETPAYTLQDFINDLNQYLPKKELNYLLVNNNEQYPKSALKLYESESAQPIHDDLPQDHLNGTKIIRADLLSTQVPEQAKGDQLARSMIRHDSAKLAREIMRLFA